MNLKITYIIVLHLLVLIAASFSQGLYSVCSGEGSTVIAVGTNGIIIRSLNGGLSWQSSIESPNDLRSVCYSENTYMAAGYNGVFRKSTDNGISWSAQNVTVNKNLMSVFFINANTGWVCGSEGVVYNTADGGANWSLQPTGSSNTLNCIKFTDSQTGWVCGSGGTVLKTSNGGNNWIQVSVPTGNELLSIDIKLNSIIAVGVYSTILRSTDNGSTWNSVDYKIITKSDVNSVFMFDENNHFTCGGGGFIRKSTDGGNSFTFPLNPMFGDLFSLYFADPNKGWAVSRKTYAVIKTTDGGNTWQLPAGTTVSYSLNRTLLSGYLHTFGDVISVFNPIRQNVVYSLIKEKLYRSGDLGNSWTNFNNIPHGAASHSQYLGMSRNDTNKMVAIICNPPTLYYTSNYGVNWISTMSLASLGPGIPIEEDPNNPDVLYFGSSTALYKSTNFGLNWTGVSSLAASKCDIEVSYGNSNIITMAVAHLPRIYRSTNSGSSFTIVNYAGVDGESPAMSTNPFYPNEIYNLFYFTNLAQDGIWKSTNYGTNWTKLYSVFAPWGITTASDDPNVIFCGLWDSVPRPAHISTNAGASFFTTNIIGSQYNANVAIFAYDKGNVLFQQTDGIYKLRVIYDVPAIGINPVSNQVPEQFLLSQNYPNPFNPSTKIRFEIKDLSYTRLEVYDINGRLVSVLVNEELKAGVYEAGFEAGDLSSGVYFYKLSAGDFTAARKMILIK